MKIIAHRGASFDAPENTLAAVRLAWRQHADAVEVDVHLTRDGRLVVIHDANTRRTAGVKRTVSQTNLHDLLALDAGSWRGSPWRGERIPTLDEVLDSVPHGKRVFVEIKTRADCTLALADILVNSRCHPDQITVIGFNLHAMQSLKRTFPKLEVCWLAVLKRGAHRPGAIAKLIEKVRHAGLDGLDLQANRILTPDIIKKLRLAGLKLYCWTVDTPATARKLAQAGVDGITTNRPKWLRDQMRTTHHTKPIAHGLPRI